MKTLSEIIHDRGLDLAPTDEPLLRWVITFPDGFVWEQEWSMRTLDQLPKDLEPRGALPDWLENMDATMTGPRNPVVVSARVRSDRVDRAREVLGL